MWVKLGLIAAAVLALLIGLLLLFAGTAQWWFERTWQRDVARVVATQGTPAPRPDAAALDALPAPVQRYLAYAMPDGIRMVGHLRFLHGGAFRLDPKGEWKPMTGREHLLAGRPGFLWNGRIRMAPGLSIIVHDHYAGGQGGVDARLLGALPLAQSGGPQVAQSALLRFLAEAVLLPPALLPSPWLRWEAMDEHHARAVISDAGITGSGVFTFDDAGRITEFYTEDRLRSVGDDFVATPFYGRMSNYERFGVLQVPARMEAGWRIDGEDVSFVRLEVVDVTYEGR